ncbi:MAG: ATP-binding protein [Venatoribacter sp.]
MNVYKREIKNSLLVAAKQLPIVLLTGPRQSGKTTLTRACFPNKPYVNLEALDHREFANEDPRGFLAQFSEGAVLDEVQQVPSLFSYLQVVVDEDPQPGRFILTGSENLSLSQSVAQSLAGRVAIRNLLPLSYAELSQFPNAPTTLWETVLAGGYPRPFQAGMNSGEWLQDYIATYIERDVRRLANLGDLSAFQNFMRLAAGRTGQEINLSGIGSDAGVSHNTIRHWLSLLEAGFLIWQIPPWFTNYTSRWVKAPKLHFVDSGLVCALLGIRTVEQLEFHPLRGAIFETWAMSEIMKYRLRSNLPMHSVYHLRQTRGVEVDIVIEEANAITGIEVKSGQTIAKTFFSNLNKLNQQIKENNSPIALKNQRIVYGGETSQLRHGVQVIPWNKLMDYEW